MASESNGLALEMVVEGSDADRPAFFDLQSATRKYAGDNPDQRYAAAVIAGDRRYRITGQRGNAVLVEISVYAGSFSGGGQRRLVASRTEEQLAFEGDGSIEVWLGPDADPAQPYQIRLSPDAINVLVRQYFGDPHDKRAHWRIERVPKPDPAPPLAAAPGPPRGRTAPVGARIPAWRSAGHLLAQDWSRALGEERGELGGGERWSAKAS